jgi:branched-subunit amino acid ABC-type transport system permease component
MFWLQLVSGLQTASILFLLAAGLSIIYGVCHVLNLAHGSFFMLAMFLAYTFTETLVAQSDMGFVLALVCVPILIAALGILYEIVVFRRLYGSDVLVQILPSIAVIFIITDVIKLFWGLESRSIDMPAWFQSPLHVFGSYIPSYYIFVMTAGAIVSFGVWLLIYKTEWGLLLRATSSNRDMATALGVNSRVMYTSVFALSLWLVGLAGVLVLPLAGANPGSDLDASVDAFAIVVIGGLGSIWGSMAAALLVGMVKAFGILIFPQFAMAFVFVLMALVLIVRPAGLFGRAE